MIENISFSHAHDCLSSSIANRLIMVDGDWNPATGTSRVIVHTDAILITYDSNYI